MILKMAILILNRWMKSTLNIRLKGGRTFILSDTKRK